MLNPVARFCEFCGTCVRNFAPTRNASYVRKIFGFFCRRHFYATDFLHSWWISCPAESPIWKNGSTLRARAMKTSLSTPLDWSSDSSFEGVIWCKRNAGRKSWAIPVLRHWTGWRFGRVRTWFPSYTNLFSSCLVFVSGDCSTEHGIMPAHSCL